MEGERRKRKLENSGEESEEEKLEKFYALIRSTKDVRDRLRANTKDKADKKDDFIEKDKGIWKPTFQPEDFIDDYQQGFFLPSTHHSSNPSAPAPSTSAKHDDVVQVADKQPPQATAPTPPPQTEDDGNHDEKANDHLDLNLSL